MNRVQIERVLIYHFTQLTNEGILNLIYEGHIQEAIDLTNKLYPTLLSKSLDVLFKLECQMFIELVRTRQLKEALKFAQEQLGKFGISDPKYMEPLQVSFFILIIKCISTVTSSL